MKLYTMKELMDEADLNNYAVGAFNFANAESLLAVIEAGQELNTNILMLGSNEEIPAFGLKRWVDLVKFMAKDFDIKVGLHLDHTGDINFIRKCMEAGVPSVMYDGSHLPIKENINNTKIVVDMAKDFGVSVEGEIGAIGRCDDLTFEGVDTSLCNLTSPKEAKMFAEETQVDALAISIGNAHGLAEALPVLNFKLLEEINKEVNDTYLVLHGGSGIPADQLRTAINLGIRKVNVASEIGRAYTQTLTDVSNREWWGHGIYEAKQAVKEVVKKWIINLSQDKINI